MHEAAINRLATAGITTGCEPARYCPSGLVTRAQMATFLARAFDLDASSVDWFGDDDRSIHQGSINRVAWAGITHGCRPSAYCPDGRVTRGQMAAFLHRAMTGPNAAPDCRLFPATNVWNRRVDSLPVASNSATMINTIGAGSRGHPDFGEYLGYGIPVNIVDSSTPRSSVSFTWPDESNAGPYPIPPSPRTEGGSDRHILMWDRRGLPPVRAVRRPPHLVGLAGRLGSDLEPALERAPTRRLDQRRCRRPADPSGPRPLRGGGSGCHQPRHPLHRSGDARCAHLPGSPSCRLGNVELTAADGDARPPQGRLRHGSTTARGCGSSSSPCSGTG